MYLMKVILSVPDEGHSNHLILSVPNEGYSNPNDEVIKV